MIGYSFPIIADTVALLCLANYSVDAFAAIWPGFVVYFNALMSPVGVIKYLRIPAAKAFANADEGEFPRLLFVTLIVTLVSTALFAVAAFEATAIFKLFNHPSNLQLLEAAYFKVMCIGAVFQLLIAGFEALMLGRLQQMVIFKIRTLGIIVTTGTMPALIFGWFGFPELGIEGVAYATALGGFAMCLGYSAQEPALKGMFRRNTLRGIGHSLASAIKIGVPSGIERGIEESAWTILILFLGTAGTFALAMGNVAINVLELAFFPAMAFGEVLSVAMATKKDDRALVIGAIKVTALYGLICMMALMAFSQNIISIYFSELQAPAGISVASVYNAFFWILGFCMIAETLYTVLNSMLLAKEDTLFPMALMLASVVAVLGAPLAWLVHDGSLTATNGWLLFLAHLTLLSALNGWRYMQKWHRKLDSGNTK